MRAHQIMTKYVTTVTPHTSIEDAANIMLRCHLSGVPVVNDDGLLVGIVSESDFSGAVKSALNVNDRPFSDSSLALANWLLSSFMSGVARWKMS
jgi:CBS-domain-containing membrane protein